MLLLEHKIFFSTWIQQTFLVTWPMACGFRLMPVIYTVFLISGNKQWVTIQTLAFYNLPSSPCPSVSHTDTLPSHVSHHRIFFQKQTLDRPPLLLGLTAFPEIGQHFPPMGFKHPYDHLLFFHLYPLKSLF